MEAQVIQGLLQYGLPTAACVVLWLAMNSRQNLSDQAALAREKRLGERIDELEDYIRGKLVDLAMQSNDAIRGADSAVREFTTIARKRPCMLELKGPAKKVIDDARAAGGFG